MYVIYFKRVTLSKHFVIFKDTFNIIFLKYCMCFIVEQFQKCTFVSLKYMKKILNINLELII